MSLPPDEMAKIIDDPSAAFRSPTDVLADNRLSDAEKIKILKQWAFDAKRLDESQGENMQGDDSILRQVLLALHKIAPDETI